MPIRKDFCAGDWARSGVHIEYMKTCRQFYIGGWYDGSVGIGSERISLGDFLRAFGITLEDCERALKDD